MNWYYAESGQQRGPVDETEWSQLVAQGVIRPETLVWNETLPNWLAWSAVNPASSTAPAAAVEADGRVRCGRCQQLVPPDETLEISGLRVCAACKPLFLQQMREGLLSPAQMAAGAGAGNGTLSEDEFLARDYSMDAVSAVAESWELVFRRPSVVWLGSLLLWGVFMAASVAFGMLQFIPILGAIITSLLNGFAAAPMEAGHANLFIRERRGLPNEVASAFAAFGPRFMDIILTHLPQAGLSMAMALGMMLLGVGAAGGMGAFGLGQAMPTLPAATVLVPLAIGGLVIGLLIAYFYTCLRFAPILVLDKGYGWKEAMSLSWRFVRKHFWQNFWLMFLSGLVTSAGVLCLCVGALVSIPVGLGMVAVVYDRHFRDLAPVSR